MMWSEMFCKFVTSSYNVASLNFFDCSHEVDPPFQPQVLPSHPVGMKGEYAVAPDIQGI